MNMEKIFGFHLVAIGCYLVIADAVLRVKRDDPWRVTTILDPPYTSKIVDNPVKNEDFDGYIPDLLKKLGSTLGHSYRITVVADGKYGAKDGDKWSGMIGEIVENKTDIAAAAITVSEARREAVSFTEPWMKIRSVIVIKKPKDGSEVKVKSAQDLASQPGIKYAVVKDGTTHQLIQSATEPNYISTIKQGLTQLVSTSKEGILKVQESDGEIAFITESATGDYWTKRKPCDLVAFEIPSLPSKEYAFAVAKGSPIKERLDAAFQSMRESGELDKITKNWWKDECSGGAILHLEFMPLVLVLLVLSYVE